MPAFKLKQLQYESDTWKRILGFMMDENIHLKNRITDILKNGFNKNQLEGVEEFQNSFIKEDELIGLMRNEVAEFDKLMVREIFEDGQIARDVYKKLNQLRHNIAVAERQFSKLKQEFNYYLLSNM
jgi:regulator of replication initiation timing